MEKIAVCVLIVNKKTCEFLSVSLKVDHSDFNLPGGKVEYGETFEDAAIREVKEETGINVYKLKFLYKEIDKDTEVLTYYTNDYDGEIYTYEKHIVKWIPLYDLNKSKSWTKYNSEVYNLYLKEIAK